MTDEISSGVATVTACCVQCGQITSDAILVRTIATASGPGGAVYACLPDARLLAAQPDAPGWLREDIAALDTAQGGPGPGRGR